MTTGAGTAPDDARLLQGLDLLEEWLAHRACCLAAAAATAGATDLRRGQHAAGQESADQGQR